MIIIRVNCDDKEKMIDQAEQELDYMAEKDSLQNPPFVNRGAILNGQVLK